MKKFGLIWLLGFMMVGVPAYAEDEGRGKNKSEGMVLEGSYHFGGDKLVTVLYVGGNTDSVEAGAGLSLDVGYRFDLGESLETVVTFGYKFDSVLALDGSGNEITFDMSRFAINGLFLYKADEKFHVGAGLTYHMMVEYSDNYQGATEIDFNDAVGFLLDARYFLSDIGYFGVRYTSIEYERSSTGAIADGSSFGIVLGAYF